MRNLLIALALLFAAPVIAEAQGQAPTGVLTYPDGSTLDGAVVELLLELGSVDHQIAVISLAMLQCIEFTLQTPEDIGFDWEDCRKEGIDELDMLTQMHEDLGIALTEAFAAKKS